MYKRAKQTINNKFIKQNFINIVVVTLLIIMLLQTCGKQNISIDGPKIIRDTTWIIKDSTINSKPQIIKTEAYGVPIDRWNTEYLPDTNYSKLVKQYELLVRELLAKNIHSDSIKIDSIGHVYITDTVSKNQIVSRTTHYNLKYPVITNTITLLAPKKLQVYVGGGLQGQKNELIDQISTGFLLKTKKDHIYGSYIGVNPSGQFQFGIQTYWKIKLK